jgi:hypothetical protein
MIAITYAGLCERGVPATSDQLMPHITQHGLDSGTDLIELLLTQQQSHAERVLAVLKELQDSW